MTPVAIVTGGQQGIGLEIADDLFRTGHKVAIVSEVPEDAPAVADAIARIEECPRRLDRRDAEALAAFRRPMRRDAAATEAANDDAAAAPEVATDAGAPAQMSLTAGMVVRYYRHDLADVAAVRTLVDRIVADLGPVTTLVSNAGVPAKVRGDMLDLTPENFDFVLDINLRGTFFLAQEVARRMVADGSDCRPYRSLVFITSVSAVAASPERSEYCISKAGAAMMAQLFAVRLAPHGIGVFDVRPGIIETAMTAAVKDRYTARIQGGLVPAGRWGKPDDVSAAVLPLVTGSFAFATGAVVPVDGGLAIHRL